MRRYDWGSSWYTLKLRRKAATVDSQLTRYWKYSGARNLRNLLGYVDVALLSGMQRPSALETLT